MKILLAIVLLGYMIFGTPTEDGQTKKPRRPYTRVTTVDGVIVDTVDTQVVYLDSNKNLISK